MSTRFKEKLGLRKYDYEELDKVVSGIKIICGRHYEAINASVLCSFDVLAKVSTQSTFWHGYHEELRERMELNEFRRCDLSRSLLSQFVIKDAESNCSMMVMITFDPSTPNTVNIYTQGVYPEVNDEIYSFLKERRTSGFLTFKTVDCI